MLNRACQQTQEIFIFQKLEELEGNQIKKKNWQNAVGFHSTTSQF